MTLAIKIGFFKYTCISFNQLIIFLIVIQVFYKELLPVSTINKSLISDIKSPINFVIYLLWSWSQYAPACLYHKLVCS